MITIRLFTKNYDQNKIINNLGTKRVYVNRKKNVLYYTVNFVFDGNYFESGFLNMTSIVDNLIHK